MNRIPKVTLRRSPFLEVTASTGYLASNQGASAFAYSPTNIRKFIFNLVGISALAAGVAVAESDAARAQPIPGIDARIVATHIPGASAISQVGTTPCRRLPVETRFPASFPRISSRVRYWIRTASSLAAGRTLAPRLPLAWGQRARCFRLTRAAQVFSKSHRISRRAEIRHQPSAAPCRCSARTALIGTTVSITRVRIQLHIPA
jgi:hypothetical protein